MKIRSILSAVATIYFCTLGSPSFAAIFNVTSDISGNYSGTLSIDTTNGTFLGGDVTVVGQQLHFTALSYSDSSIASLGTQYGANSSVWYFQYSQGTGFTGYTGGAITATYYTNCFVAVDGWSCGGFPTNSNLGAGTLTIQAAVPELSTWAMMILGFAGVGYMAYRRRRQAPALTAA